ncbi:GNAT family N-acetyltransferase [Williamsia serinedens]|uniref:GNAT family N-acetyltransferase n=1 Tax=Williamsia serinedens TaxID=391736 RepID=UPI0020A35064|nr:GNAT family N-acetyltransferase [Williamsia serinedens]
MNVAADPGPVAGLRWEWARGADPTLPAEPDNEFVAAVRDWMADPTRTVWTAGEDPVGMVCLTEYTRMPSPSDAAGGRWGYLGHLYVRPEARGGGVGDALVRTVVAEAIDRGHAKVVLSPSLRSIPLYRRCGFTDDNDLMVWRP